MVWSALGGGLLTGKVGPTPQFEIDVLTARFLIADRV